MNKHFRIPGLMAEKLIQVGIPVSAVLRRAGLPAGLFEQTRVLVSTEELFALWRAIGEVSDDPAIALKLGTETRSEKFHPSGVAALSNENFGAAVACVARYKRLTCPEELVHDMHGDEWPLRFRWLLAVENEPQLLVDYCFAWVQSIARHGSGTTLSPLRIEIVQPRANTKHLERHFGCEIVTGAANNVIVYRATDAACPFVTRNADLLDMLAPQFDNELSRINQQHTFSDQVRDAIQQRLTGHRPNVDDIARDLHMSSRTLQRRLQEHGSSYQRVLDEARHQMARYYLGNSVLELNEAAYLLGYEDTNSFTRAFRSWEGVPPSQWRETHSAISLN
jgi:AraC-like DNA-binding protein